MPDVFAVAKILVNHALRAHTGEIAIVAYYGSYAKGLATPTSDLDIFYIPDEGKGGSLCTQFVLDGLPYDFWPVSWEMAEGIASASSHRPWAVSASLIADAHVLYSRSPQDLERFQALQARIEALTRPENRRTMIGKGLDAFKEVLFQQGQMRLAAAHDDRAGLLWAGQKFVNGASNCLALVHQTYFSKGWGSNLPQVLALPGIPAGMEQDVRAILFPRDAESMLEAAGRLAQGVRDILLEVQAEGGEPAGVRETFKDFYFFVFEYRNKVLAACEAGDAVKACFAAFQLQEELCQLMNRVERGFYGTNFNLLGEYAGVYDEVGFPDLLEPAAQGDLKELAQRTRQLDARVRAWLEEHGVDLGILGSKEALRRFLEERDPVGKDKGGHA